MLSGLLWRIFHTFCILSLCLIFIHQAEGRHTYNNDESELPGGRIRRSPEETPNALDSNHEEAPNCTQEALDAHLNDTAYTEKCNSPQEGRLLLGLLANLGLNAASKGIETGINVLSSDAFAKGVGKAAEMGGNFFSKAWETAGNLANGALNAAVAAKDAALSAASTAATAVTAGAVAVKESLMGPHPAKRNTEEKLPNAIL